MTFKISNRLKSLDDVITNLLSSKQDIKQIKSEEKNMVKAKKKGGKK